jgi:ABC-type multidrug transport system ATPase subunit
MKSGCREGAIADAPRMLSLEEIAVDAGEGDAPHYLLEGVSVQAARGELVGVIGPSGCGKSTLLKIIAGLIEPTDGVVRWDGRDLENDGDFSPAELGYVPQFSLAHEGLTVSECVDYAARLRVGGLERAERAERVQALLQTTGLEALADRQARVLSGGQRRRLSLAIEMVSSPALLLCDEVTSGLDPGSSREILALLHSLSRADGGGHRLVINVTHSLTDLQLYDRLILLCEGRVAYNGGPGHLAHYFRVDDPEEVFVSLGKRSGVEWHNSWLKHGPYYTGVDVPVAENLPEEPSGETPDDPKPITDSTDEAGLLPSVWSQFATVFERRLRLFTRDRTQLTLQGVLIAGFPCLVAIFALKGLPQIRNLSLANDLSVVDQLRETTSYLVQAFDVGGLVSGLLLFQIILLALMGSNNGALEIAGERLLFEREKLAGLSTASYLGAKGVFLALLVTAQSVWMVLFVHLICSFPGDIFGQVALLWLADASLTAVCLAFSSFARTASQASLISIYFVGFQLPLSGAVLALPDAAAKITRPFIAAFWSWAGAIQTMRDTRFYDLILTITKTELAAAPVCYWVLIAQTVLGMFIAYVGCQRNAWD